MSDVTAPENARRWRWAGWILGIVVVAGLPQLLSPLDTEQVTRWIPLAVAAIGLNLLVGYNGQISVGHGALFGLGAYACGIWVDRTDGGFLVGVLVAMVVAFAAGIVIGLPALRVRGIALALLTIAVGALFPDIVLQLESITGGTSGLFMQESVVNRRGATVTRALRWEAPGWTGLSPDEWRFYVFGAIALLCLAVVAALIRSRTGRALVAVRDNEIAAEVNGIAVDRVKLITFGISGALAGIGGALFAMIDFSLTPDAFRLPLSLNLLVIVVIGGSGTTLGPIAGAVGYGIFQDVIAEKVLPSNAGLWTPLVLGLGLVLAMQTAPGGTVGSIAHLVEQRRTKRAQRAAAGPAPSS